MSKIAKGGCLCGAVRFEAKGEPFGANHCHCLSCRKHTGAPVVTLSGWKADQITFSGKARKIYNSSEGVGRAFCPECGTPLTWEGISSSGIGAIVEIHISTFDDQTLFLPTSHMHDGERIPWFDVADNLPRYTVWDDGNPPAHIGPKSKINKL